MAKTRRRIRVGRPDVIELVVGIPLVSGRCRWCSCTEERPCDSGCWWVDRSYTLCSECVPLDTAMQTIRGRRQLAAFIQEHVEGQAMPVAEAWR
jgi:hypothetical protein